MSIQSKPFSFRNSIGVTFHLDTFHANSVVEDAQPKIGRLRIALARAGHIAVVVEKHRQRFAGVDRTHDFAPRHNSMTANRVDQIVPHRLLDIERHHVRRALWPAERALTIVAARLIAHVGNHNDLFAGRSCQLETLAAAVARAAANDRLWRQERKAVVRFAVWRRNTTLQKITKQ
jgi:hypothetical protein